MASLYQTFHRYKTLHTHTVTSLPVVILMPHSACNCRCVMCDIWKDNRNLKQLTEADIRDLLASFERYGTRQVLMSGGEALLNPNFFTFCEILKGRGISISLLSTGITLKKNAARLVKWVDEIIVSLDGDPQLHDAIRNIPGAFDKLADGIAALRALNPRFRISARTVIHRLNFYNWQAIIDTALRLGLDRISFLPADVTSTAFNREETWSAERQGELLPDRHDLVSLQSIIDLIIVQHADSIRTGIIAESAQRLQHIHDYYAAHLGLGPFPYKKCNAPWVSTVIEADGSVRPCFFHQSYGNIHQSDLDDIVNGEEALHFRRSLDMDTNPVCMKCVCHLYLSPWKNIS